MTIRLVIDHVIFLIRGCKHPKYDLDGVSFVEDADGVTHVLFHETCAVCGAPKIQGE